MAADTITDGNGAEGVVRVAAECDHGGRPCLVEVTRNQDGGVASWTLSVFYACNDECASEAVVDFEPQRVVDTNGARLPWAWR